MKFAVIPFFMFLFVEAAGGQGIAASLIGIQSGDSVRPTQDTSSGIKTRNKRPVTDEDVVRMVKAGLAEGTIVLAIQQGPTEFDTSPDALISLRSQGLTQKVLDAMLAAKSDHAQPLPPPSGAPAGST